MTYNPGMATPPVDSLCYGDCLDWMNRWEDASVDLIYLDPPFNSNATYNVLYARDSAGGAQTRAFEDTWSWDAAAGERLARYEGAAARPAHRAIVGLAGILGPSGMLAYLTYMAERLERMHCLLKPTGSLYLHCDPTASHYLKVLLDAIFGGDHFRNEIVWSRSKNPKGSQHKMKRFSPFTDTLLYYVRSHAATIHSDRIRIPLTEDELAQKYPYKDELGRYADGPILRSDSMGARPNLVYSYKGFTPGPAGWRVKRDVLEEIDKKGNLAWTKTGGVRRKLRPSDIEKGRPIGSLWGDIAPINSQAQERLGYPTQKPRALLERIIKASSNEGDLVLDPFCGCGTTVDTARRLRRRWVGIDISAFAIDLVRDRRLKNPAIPTYGIPADLEGARKLAAEQPFAFESWAVTRLPGFAPNTRQRGDGGVDGRATLAVAPDDADSRLALAQVKGGRFSVSYLRDFRHVIDRERAALGCFVTLDPGPARHRADAKTAGRVHVAGQPYDRLHLWSIADYFDERLPVLPVMTDPYSGRPLNQPGLF